MERSITKDTEYENTEKISEIRDYKVVKSNDLIQKSRYNLSLQEQKIILFLISKIKPEDMDLKEHMFKVVDFCKICGLHKDSGANYKYIKQTLKDLRDKSVWVELENGTETTLSWIDKITMNKRGGTIIIKIDDMMKPYLLHLQERFTQYEILYTLAMKSQYSIRLYEILKSYEYLHRKTFDIDELKRVLCAENYERFSDFRRKVLEISKREINQLSDINISYETIKKGRKYAQINFSIKLKRDTDIRLKTWTNIENAIDKKNWSIKRALGE